MSKQHRRNSFAPTLRRSRRPSGNGMLIAAGVLFLSGVVYVISICRPAADAAEPVVATAGADVRLDVAKFDDGRAHFYSYMNAAGKQLRFFALKSSDGVIRAAFDTCDVCYRERKGYRQVGDTMVCNNCGKAFRSIDINVLQGGCNPVPLDRAVQDGQVELTATALGAGSFYF